MCKLFSGIINQKLENWSDAHKARAKGQGGFRKQRRIEDNILVVRTLVERARISGRQLFLTFIDLEKAYDNIDRKKLWARLIHSLGLPQDLLAGIKRIYKNI